MWIVTTATLLATITATAVAQPAPRPVAQTTTQPAAAVPVPAPQASSWPPKATPYPKDASLETISRWLHDEYSRLAYEAYAAREEMQPSRGTCSVISVMPRADVLTDQEWAALARRCNDEILHATPPEQVHALNFIRNFEQVSMMQPGLAATLPDGFGAAIATALASPDREVRLAAAWAAGTARRIGKDALEVLPNLLKVLADSDAKLRFAALQALSDLSYGRHDASGVETQAPGFGEHGPAALKALLAVTHDKDSKARLIAFTTIGNLGEAARPAIPALVAATKSEDRITRTGGFMALKALRAVAVDALPDLLLSLRNGPERDRIQAAHALGAMGAGAKDAVAPLIEALDDPAPHVTYAAARALSEIGPEAAAALPRLMSAVSADPGAFSGFGQRAIDRITGNER